MQYVHVDVFSPGPFGGNSLPVFVDARGLETGQMQAITRELRHFEAIFLEPADRPERVRARVFDLFEELPFAGHPIIGAAAVLHRRSGAPGRRRWQIELRERVVDIETTATERGYYGLLDQGAPQFLGTVRARESVARAFSLDPADLIPGLPLEVVSTGLRYLVVPVQSGALQRARIRRDISDLLGRWGAQFAVLLDERALEIRHWNNDGLIEDVATGSAAGTVGAYRLRHGLAAADEAFTLRQGRFAGRASTLSVCAEGSSAGIARVKVGGHVSFVGSGSLEALP
jgi:PhzF family phenazine biosynthesis protein